MKTRFPDLTLFLDAGGRYSHSKDVPIVFAGVAIKTKTVDAVREALLAATKGHIFKWSKSNQARESAKIIFRILGKGQVCGVVRIIWKNTAEWDRYFEDGQRLYEKGVKRAQEAIPYAKPMNTFKLHQFGLVSADLLGFYAQRHRNRLPKKNAPVQSILVTDVFDSDIQGQTNQDVCKDVFAQIQGSLPQTEKHLRIRPEFKVTIKTEEEEPLLFLPDHLAGYYYSRKAYDAQEQEGWGSLLAAVEPLIVGLPPNCYHIAESSFRDEYPLSQQPSIMSFQRRLERLC